MKTGHKLEITLCGRVAASFRDEKDLMETAAARITEWDAIAKHHASQAVQLALSIGAVLIAVRDRLPHGAFMAWVSTRCGGVSYQTARNYMRLAEAAIAQGGAPAGGPDGDGEIIEGEATVGDAPAAPSSSVPRPSSFQIDERSLSQLYLDYGIVRRPQKWGGARPNSGRPPKGAAEEVAKELDAAANSEALLWSAAGGAIDTLSKLDAEKDFLHRLADEHLADASKSLSVLSKKAGEILAGRLARRDMGFRGEAMETAEAVNVLKGGL